MGLIARVLQQARRCKKVIGWWFSQIPTWEIFVWSPYVPLRLCGFSPRCFLLHCTDMHVRIIGNSKLAAGVSVGGCFFSWSGPVTCCLPPKTAGVDPSNLRPSLQDKGWQKMYVFISIAEFVMHGFYNPTGSERLIQQPHASKMLCSFHSLSVCVLINCLHIERME